MSGVYVYNCLDPLNPTLSEFEDMLDDTKGRSPKASEPSNGEAEDLKIGDTVMRNLCVVRYTTVRLKQYKYLSIQS